MEKEIRLLDITNPENVEIRIRGDGKVIWVNVDGICRLRCCGITCLDINDERRSLHDVS